MIEKWYKYDQRYNQKRPEYRSIFYYHLISIEEYERFEKTKKFPITGTDGRMYWYDEDGKLHKTDGPAYVDPYSCDSYFLHGVEYKKEKWEKQCLRRIIFSAQKIKTIKKLLYIPELFQNIFYDRKSQFISLLQKL